MHVCFRSVCSTNSTTFASFGYQFGSQFSVFLDLDAVTPQAPAFSAEEYACYVVKFQIHGLPFTSNLL